MTIYGKGPVKLAGSNFAVRASALRLPKDLKSVWPDPEKRSGYFPADTSSKIPRMNGELIIGILGRLGIGTGVKILDIGAYDNAMAKYFHEQGFTKAKGIDVDPAILKSPYGRQINLRDLDRNEKYHVITACNFADHLPGGGFCSGPNPSFELVALKLRMHLLPKGHFIFCDSTQNAKDLLAALQENGFEFLSGKSLSVYRVFQKK